MNHGVLERVFSSFFAKAHLKDPVTTQRSFKPGGFDSARFGVCLFVRAIVGAEREG